MPLEAPVIRRVELTILLPQVLRLCFTSLNCGVYSIVKLQFHVLAGVMLISELARKSGLSKDTLRFYKEIGLIEAEARQAGTRIYMEFSPEMLERLLMITQGKSLGFTLNEMKHLLETWGSTEMPIAEKLRIIDRKLDQMTEKMHQLEEIQSFLTVKRNKITQESDNSKAFAISPSLES
jgi:MerR family transcriptional regulator, copper efflux regulator